MDYVPNENQANSFADMPIKNKEQDQLGFHSIAEKLAKSIIANQGDEGFVVGIEGAWGSGKSSLVNLVCNCIEKEKKPYSIIRFEPWLIGNRDALVSEFMSELSLLTKKNRAVAKKIKKFASKFDRSVTPTINLLSCMIALAPFAFTSTLLSFWKTSTVLMITAASRITAVVMFVVLVVCFLFKLFSAPVPLPVLKQDISNKLKNSRRHTIVIMDDIDRLEPKESAEIVRLIKSVANFPYITYVLCYDKSIFAEHLERALKIKDGTVFLEKIIQISFSVPTPEHYTLIIFSLEKIILFYRKYNSVIENDMEEKIESICTHLSFILQKPRDVVRILNALSLIYPPLKDKIYFPDLLWLQIIRIKNKKLYKWIEKYLILINGGPWGLQRKSMYENLCEILKLKQDTNTTYDKYDLNRYLPGIKPRLSSENDIFAEKSNVQQLHARRLKSSEHYRLYFALDKPMDALDNIEFERIINKIKTNESIDEDLRKLINEKMVATSGTMYCKFLLRLLDMLNNTSDLSPTTQLHMLKAISNTVDDDCIGNKFCLCYKTAKNIFKKTLSSIDGKERNEFVTGIFDEAKSIGFLLTELIDNSEEDDKIFDGKELKNATEAIHNRIENIDSICEIPKILDFITSLKRVYGDEQLKNYINKITDTDEKFLDLMDRPENKGFSFTPNSSDTRREYPIQKNMIEIYMSYEDALQRLKNIAKNGDANTKEKAENLLDCLEHKE